jgi:cytochrome c biogenesis protein CcmG/thiol:disulfide interchange protein DsbE
MHSKSVVLTFLLIAASATVADEATVRAKLQAPNQRQPAPAFTLIDSAGKRVSLRDYRGRIVLLDFWATWCTGCKHEIPWFVEFQKEYEAKGLTVIGVSLDGDGWKVLKPFLAQHPIPYSIVLGDDAMAKRYGIESMPDTFLIDQRGRVAAAYRAGIVNKDDMEANIKAMLTAGGAK